MEAGTLLCPQCGAPVSQDATECDHCHAFLQTVACPKCLGMMFVGSKFCPHCGALAVSIQQGDDSSHPCPRCQIPLKHVEIADTPLEECTRCGGLWIGVSCFEHICSDAQARQAATGLVIEHPADIDPNVRYLKCPRCQDLMSRINYAQHSGVIINVCRNHGVWLDRDAMRQIVAFISSGGLDRARRLESEELEEAQRLQSASIDDILATTTTPSGSFHESFTAEEGSQFLNGVASVLNHFLGEK